MSSLDDADIPSLSFQKAELSGYMNSTMVTVLLMGIYTVVYACTVFIYIHQKAHNRTSILGVITLIFVLSWTAAATDWYENDLTFIANGDTMLDAFNFMYNSTSSLDTISNICQNLIIVLADGLLMWRCYLVWTGSRQVAWIPCILWVIEAALSITIAAAELAWLNDLSNSRAQLLNVLTAALFFMSALTSLISTFLIAYRIYVASRLTGASKRQFMNVIDIVVQSSAVYTLSVLAVAIYDVIPFQDSDSATIAIDMVVNYVGSIALVLIGMMPTLMVARVAMSSGYDGTTAVSGTEGKPSTIHFQSRGADFRQSWVSADSDELDFYDEGWKKDALDRV